MSREHGTARGIGRKVALALVTAGIAGSVVAGTAFASEPAVARSCDDPGVVARTCTQARTRAMLRDSSCDSSGACANGDSCSGDGARNGNGTCDGSGPAGRMQGDAECGQARQQRLGTRDGACHDGQCARHGGGACMS